MKLYDTFVNVLSKHWAKKKNIILLGDFNSDLLTKNTNNQHGRKLERILQAFDLKNIIKEPTHIISTTETLIDLVIVSNQIDRSGKISACGTFEPAISDHKLIFCTLNIKSSHEKPIYKCVKDRRALSQEKFQKLLDQALWWVATTFEDVSDVAYAWECMYKDILKDLIKERIAKVRAKSLPWITRDIKKIMNQRYKALLRWQREKENMQLKEDYKKLRNKVNLTVRKAEATYWKDRFEEASSSREFWQLVSKIRGKSINTNISDLKDENGSMKVLDQEKADLLNNFFANIGKNLAKNFSTTVNENDSSFINRVTPVCSEINLDVKFLNHQVATLKPFKAMGVDKISPREFKMGGDSVVPGLQIVLNKIIEGKTVPDSWKKARLKSAFKKGPKDETENYRPLSMLTIPSKLLEGQICRPINNHLDLHHLSTPAQWGFKEGKSTEGLLLHMTEDWRKALDRKQVIGILFIDFRKAFDLVSHVILKKKLQACGISGHLFELLENYLQNRSQFVELNGASSDTQEISYGVPQGY